jgi:adenylate cyclase
VSPVTAAGTRTGALAFTDIVGFTQLTAIHGDDVALALVERQEALTQSSLPANGRIVKQLGDGLLLFFDDATAAFAACCALHTRAARESVEGLPLWIRTGLHWGTPRVRGDDFIGHDVNVAARISDLAGEGEILCSEAFVDACGDHARNRVQSIGPLFLRGVADPVNAYRVC